jgi:hypothetical protein
MTVEWKAGAHALSVVLGLAMVVMGCGGGGDPDAGTAADEGVSPDQGMVVEDGGLTDACAAQEDLPDEDNVDSNCDGIDGDADDAVFVTTTGSLVESSTVGTRAMPAGSIAFGHLARAGAWQVAGPRGRRRLPWGRHPGRGRRGVRRLQRGGRLGAHGGHRHAHRG